MLDVLLNPEAGAAASVGLAYIGPGPGLSMTWALFGLVLTVLAALWAIVLWPARLLLRRLRAGRGATPAEPDAGAAPASGAAAEASDNA